MPWGPTSQRCARPLMPRCRQGRPRVADHCELCEAARITPWFHEDELCWIAECEICAVPMVVWRAHDPSPPDEVKAQLHARLAAVVATPFEFEHYVDDHM